MAWIVVGTGAATTRAGSSPPANWSIPLPANLIEDDLILLQIQTFGVNASPPIPQNPTGWTQLALITNGGTSNHRHYFGYTRYSASTVTPVVSFTGTGTTGNNGDSYSARTRALRSSGAFTWDIDVIGTASTNASANSIGPAAAITPTVTSSGSTIVVGSFGKPNDFAGAGTPPTGYTGILTETTLGSDSSCYYIERIVSQGVSTGNLTVTDTGQAGVGASILVSFKEVPDAPVANAARSYGIII